MRGAFVASFCVLVVSVLPGLVVTVAAGPLDPTPARPVPTPLEQRAGPAPVAQKGPMNRGSKAVDLASGAQPFLEIARVLQSPRCQNCHPAADAPLQTDAGLPHAMLVKRGPEGRGLAAMRCSNCHMSSNSTEPHGPPGAPNWHLPPPETPMIFEGRGPDELCRTIKDPRRNGGKDLQQLVHHLTTDSLVLWGWNPGVGRTLPPLSQPEFARVVHEWAEAGAPCPGDSQVERSESPAARGGLR